jgi:hypothetical protein
VFQNFLASNFLSFFRIRTKNSEGRVKEGRRKGEEKTGMRSLKRELGKTIDTVKRYRQILIR